MSALAKRKLTVAEYLAGQAVDPGEAAQDAYLELMQQLADGAFVLLLESGLAASGDKQTLRAWRELGRAQEARVHPGRLGQGDHPVTARAGDRHRRRT